MKTPDPRRLSPLGRLTAWIHGNGGHLVFSTSSAGAQIQFIYRGKTVGTSSGNSLEEAAAAARQVLPTIERQIKALGAPSVLKRPA